MKNKKESAVAGLILVYRIHGFITKFVYKVSILTAIKENETPVCNV